ncbi:hypothetical protein KR222_007770, partial [Zaprionus bogoriensis]
SQSQSHSHSHSQVRQSQGETEHLDVDAQVRAILNFILCHSASKVPIKLKDLLALTAGKNEVAKRMPLVTKLLEERYGIRLVQLEAPKRYICMAEAPMTTAHELTAAQRPQYTLLYIILTYIFLRGNRVEEEKLFGMLDSLKVNVHEEHSYFGEHIIKMIEETFVKQQYLKRERSQLSPYDDPKFFYTWGLRAKSECSYQQVVQFASKLFNQDASLFQQQLSMAEGEHNLD